MIPFPSGTSQPPIPQPVPVPVPHPPQVAAPEPLLYTLPLPVPYHPLSSLHPPITFSPPPSPAAAASSHATSPAPSTITSRMTSPAVGPLHLSDHDSGSEQRLSIFLCQWQTLIQAMNLLCGSTISLNSLICSWSTPKGAAKGTN